MKVKINIEIFDKTSISQLEESGLSDKFLKIAYEESFMRLLDEICSSDISYSLFVEIEDNTMQ